MKLTASILTVFAASILLLQSCGSDTASDKAELTTVLDAAADREGVPSGECRDDCVRAALAVFDGCMADGGDREACFGRAIHTFFECVTQCPPPTCEERCEAKARQHQMQCLDERGTVDGCNREARELLARCQEEACMDPEPPTCEGRCEGAATEMRDACVADDGDVDECNMDAREALAMCIAEHCEEPPTCEDKCGAFARLVHDVCLHKIDSEERCAAVARYVHEHCMDRCEGHPCDCDDRCDDDDSDTDSDCDSDSDSDSDSDTDSDSDSDTDSDSDSDSDTDSDTDSDSDSDSDKDCDPDGPMPKKGGHCN